MPEASATTAGASHCLGVGRLGLRGIADSKQEAEQAAEHGSDSDAEEKIPEDQADNQAKSRSQWQHDQHVTPARRA